MCTSNEIKLHLEVEINGVDQSRLSDIGVDRQLPTLVIFILSVRVQFLYCKGQGLVLNILGLIAYSLWVRAKFLYFRGQGQVFQLKGKGLVLIFQGQAQFFILGVGFSCQHFRGQGQVFYFKGQGLVFFILMVRVCFLFQGLGLVRILGVRVQFLFVRGQG